MKITKEELAHKLNGIQINTISKEDIKDAKDSDLIIVYGHSDDCVEIDGYITDEISAFDGVTFEIDKEGPLGIWENIRENISLHDAKKYIDRKFSGHTKKIKAVWDDGSGYSWTFQTGVPYSNFDIFCDKDKFCQGIIININDL